MILPVSHDLAAGLKYLGIKTPMKVIPNVVNTNLFVPKSEPNERFTFIHVSNLIARKNSDKILKTALRLLQKGYDLSLKIGGDDDVSKLIKIGNSSKYVDKINVVGIQPINTILEKMKMSDF